MAEERELRTAEEWETKARELTHALEVERLTHNRTVEGLQRLNRDYDKLNRENLALASKLNSAEALARLKTSQAREQYIFITRVWKVLSETPQGVAGVLELRDKLEALYADYFQNKARP